MMKLNMLNFLKWWVQNILNILPFKNQPSSFSLAEICKNVKKKNRANCFSYRPKKKYDIISLVASIYQPIKTYNDTKKRNVFENVNISKGERGYVYFVVLIVFIRTRACVSNTREENSAPMLMAICLDKSRHRSCLASVHVIPRSPSKWKQVLNLFNHDHILFFLLLQNKIRKSHRS